MWAYLRSMAFMRLQAIPDCSVLVKLVRISCSIVGAGVIASADGFGPDRPKPVTAHLRGKPLAG